MTSPSEKASLKSIADSLRRYVELLERDEKRRNKERDLQRGLRNGRDVRGGQ